MDVSLILIHSTPSFWSFLSRLKISVGAASEKRLRLFWTCNWLSMSMRIGFWPATSRTVKEGLSLRAVCLPTRILISWLRQWCTRALVSSPVIQLMPFSFGPLSLSKKPSLVCAHLSVTYGRCFSWKLKKRLLSCRASVSSTPIVTWMPAFWSLSMPLPDTFGLGSFTATTTCAIFLSMSKLLQGGVLPKCAQGSKLT